MTEPQAPPLAQCLVVDDQRTIRKAIRRILESKLNYAVEEATSSKEAVRYLESHPADLILSDIYMPKGDGFELLRHVRGRSFANDIPVVFISGESTKEDIVKAASLKITDYVLKPFETEDFVAKIKQVMDEYLNPAPRAKLLRAGEGALLSDNLQQAQHIFQELLKIEPESPRYLVGLARSLMKNEEKKEEALNLLYRSMQINNLYFPAYAVAADFCILHNRTQDAMQFLMQELSINGKQPHRRKALAMLFRQDGEFQKAAEEMRLALIESPHNEDLLLCMGTIQKELGNQERSQRYYVRAWREDPSNALALQGILELYSEKDLQKAFYAFSDLYTQNPHHHELLIFRAQALKLMGEDERCLSELEKYSEIHPEHQEVLILRIQLFQKLGKEDRAASLCEALVRLAPTEDNWGRLGLAQLRNQNYAAAVSAYAHAVKINPKSPKYHFNMGVCYEKQENWTQAKERFSTVLKMTPGHKEAQLALQRIVAKSRQAG